MADDKRIADDFLYGNREQRKERRIMRKKNIVERKVYKKNARRLGDPRTYTNAMLNQMKVDDKGEMSALINAQQAYAPIINSNRTLSNSLSTLNASETSLYGSPQTAITGSSLDTKGIIDVPDKKKGRDNPIKKLVNNIKEGVKTRKLRKQSLKKEYNNFIADIKLIEGDNFNEDKVPSYRKWKKKWNAGDMMGVGLADEDRNKLEALAFNKGKPIEKQKVFHNGQYILRSELEQTINPVTGGNIQERETAIADFVPASATSNENKDSKKIDKSLYSYQKSWDLFFDDGKGPLKDHLDKYYGGSLSDYFKKNAPGYDHFGSSDAADFDKYVEISQGWWGSDKGKKYKSKHNIKRKKQMGGIKKYQTGGEKKGKEYYDARNKRQREWLSGTLEKIGDGFGTGLETNLSRAERSPELINHIMNFYGSVPGIAALLATRGAQWVVDNVKPPTKESKQREKERNKTFQKHLTPHQNVVGRQEGGEAPTEGYDRRIEVDVESNYSKRNAEKAAKLNKRADKREKYWADYDKEMNEMHGEGNWTEGATRLLTGKRARKRAKIAANKAKAGSRKAYRKGKKEGIYQAGGCKGCGGMYQDGGFLETPIPKLFED